jgi:prepilin-type processing-associated H-X9-DG protein/prepilin-type N-terminal cleavage/methylation domain-containing protein
MKSSKRLLHGGERRYKNMAQRDFSHWPAITSEDEKALIGVMRVRRFFKHNIAKEFELKYAAWQSSKYGLWRYRQLPKYSTHETRSSELATCSNQNILPSSFYTIKLHTREELGFTLIELLAAIAIIVVLLALLLPIAGKMRNSSQTAVCTSNLKQIYIAAQSYSQDKGKMLTSQPSDLNLPPGTPSNLVSALRPYLSGTNQGNPPKAGDLCSGVFRCPSSKNRIGPGLYGSDYGINATVNRLDVSHPSYNPAYPTYPVLTGVPEASKVFFLVDAHDIGSTPSVASRDVKFSPGSGMVEFRHSGAANILFYDGHVELQKESSCVIKHGQPSGSGGLKKNPWQPAN